MMIYLAVAAGLVCMSVIIRLLRITLVLVLVAMVIHIITRDGPGAALRLLHWL
jgi:hypothetical protein